MENTLLPCISIIPCNGRFFVVIGETSINGPLDQIHAICTEVGSPYYHSAGSVISELSKALEALTPKLETSSAIPPSETP